MSEKFRVIIAAVRDFSNYELLRNKCDEFLHDKVDRGIVVFCGTDKGSFSLGKRYAQEKGYMIEVFSADWKKYANRAGYIRDFQMVNSAHALIAFWDGESKEGKRKIDFARRIGIEVYVPHYEYLNFGSSLEMYLSDVSLNLCYPEKKRLNLSKRFVKEDTRGNAQRISWCRPIAVS